MLEDSGLYKRRYSDAGASVSRTSSATTSLRTGLARTERERNDELTGRRSELTSVVDQLRDRERVGDSVVTNVDADAQRVAIDALDGRKGSVVALSRRRKVRVMVSTPGYDPNTLDEPGVFTALASETRRCSTAPRRAARPPARR